MSPTIATPRSSRSSNTTARVAVATAAIGPALAMRSAGRDWSPALIRSGLRPFRTPNRNDVERTPLIKVERFVCPRLEMSGPTSAGLASPEAERQEMDLSWLVAVIISDAVKQPGTTGGDRRGGRYQR